MNAFESFVAGALEGAGVSGVPEKEIMKVLERIAPLGERSDWRDLIFKLEPNDAGTAGHQFACMMFAVSKNDQNRDGFLANLYRFTERFVAYHD